MKENSKIQFAIKSALPDNSISQFVHSFWMVENTSGEDISSIVLPNGMVDMIVMKTHKNWSMLIRGIDTMPKRVTIAAGTKMASIGFKLLAVEYLFKEPIKDVLNEEKDLSNDFWQFEENDLKNLEAFCNKATQKIKTIPVESIDNRKQKLFQLIYDSHGSMPVKALSENVFWSCRQINRYFNEQFGISLKAYCNILRFGESIKHLSEGKLFPEHDFTDQNHFIKEIKKYAGVTPKVLSKNQDEQFINITAIKELPLKNG